MIQDSSHPPKTPIPDCSPNKKSVAYVRHRQVSIFDLCADATLGSPVCFILAAFNYPGAVRSAWGCMGDEMDEDAWDLLNGPGDGAAHGELSQALGMLVKMTRLYDLGLSQLCFSDDQWTDTEF